MKKYLYLIPVAALAMTACTNESDEFVGSSESREISFMPVNQMATRTAVDGTVFPTTMDMTVAAFDATNHREFFGKTTFTHADSKTYDGELVAKDYWTGGKYWPLSPTYINFLAYADFQGSTATLNWGSDDPATNPTLALVMTDNSSEQKDLMYAWGYGEVTQSSNTLTFPKYVAMQFKHAQAWITFNARAKDAAETNMITLNSITLVGAKYSGTYTITYTNGRNTSSQSIAGAWSSLGDAQNVVVPNWTPATIAYVASGDGQAIGDGLMIVPDGTASGDFTKFIIEYVLDSKTYTYEYTPASTDVSQGNHYIYNIVFDLHEIEITPTVLDWADQTPVSVPIF